MHHFYDDTQIARAISPVSVSDNTPAVSEIIDAIGWRGLEFVILIGEIADDNATFAVTLDQSDDAFATSEAVPTDNIAGSLADASFTFAADNATRKIGVKELTKRYYRLTVTPSSNGAPATLAAVATLHAASRKR